MPENGELALELVGDLAGILALGDKARRTNGTQLTLVAGARNHLNLLFNAPGIR